MKQALVKKGIVLAEEVPAPVVSKGSVLIKVVNSCISSGTEMAGVISSGTPLIKRISKQPEKISKALNLIRSDGIMKAYKQIKGEMDAGRPTGYSLSGIVIATGEGVHRFKEGDSVAAAGGGLANHAEYVDVPENLVVKIPNKLDFPQASTVTLGAIAMHGVRRAGLSIGEFAVVYGTGILGLLSVQILKNAGVRVIAIDIDDSRLDIAARNGAEYTINPVRENPVESVMQITDGHGSDAVLFTASTSSNEPLSLSFQMCRRKGRVILVGVSGMDIRREDIYQKEIDFMISTSYGPGRYDPTYEEKGVDYPYAYVRWTENRNLKEYLRLLATGKIDLSELISDVYPVEELTKAFQSLKSSERKPLMVLLDYGKPDFSKLESYRDHPRSVAVKSGKYERELVKVALIGAGRFATHMHLPNLDSLKSKYALKAIVDNDGARAKSVAAHYGVEYATTQVEEVLQDKNIDLAMICTRHDTHASLVMDFLGKGKNVFVEKPLAATLEELDQIKNFYAQSDGKALPLVMVGFNRRFSPLIQQLKRNTDKRINPLFIHYRMNAGSLPADHWIYEQGGRIVGEACHIIDLFLYITGAQVEKISYEFLHPSGDHHHFSDNVSIILSFTDGSMAVLDYFSTGNSNYPKEFMEVHFDKKTIILDDYRFLEGYGISLKKKLPRPDKGHLEELKVLHQALTAGSPQWPIPLEDLFQTTEITHLIR